MYPGMRAYETTERRVPRTFFNLDIRWSCAISVGPRLLFLRQNSTRYTLGRVLICPGIDLNALKKRIMFYPYQESNGFSLVFQPAASHFAD